MTTTSYNPMDMRVTRVRAVGGWVGVNGIIYTTDHVHPEVR